MDKQKIYFVERGDYEFSEVVYLSLDYEKAKNFAVKHYEEFPLEDVFLNEVYLDDDLTYQVDSDEQPYGIITLIHNEMKRINHITNEEV